MKNLRRNSKDYQVLKLAKAEHKKSIGSPMFSSQRNDIISHFVNSSIPNWNLLFSVL